VTSMEDQVAREQAEYDQNGKSLEDAAAEGEGLEDDGTMQLVLPGTAARLTATAGGKRPTSSMFKMQSISLPISENQQLDKGETIWVAVECRVRGTHFDDQYDGREIGAVVRTHVAKPMAVMVLDGPPEGADE